MAAGNAVRLIIAPPSEAHEWLVLRKTTDTIGGPDDATAVTVADWDNREDILDLTGLVNGTAVFYRAFYRRRDASPVLPHLPSSSATPAYTARDTSADPLRLLRERFEAGLAIAVQQGRLHPRTGVVPLVMAPFVDPAKTTFPMMSMHLESDQPMEHGIGEYIAGHSIDGIGADETEGWLSQIAVNLIAVSLNPDERIELGRVMKHIVAANLEIFSSRGLIRPALTIAHTELLPEANAAPLYLATGSFTCLAASDATATGVPVETVTNTPEIV